MTTTTELVRDRRHSETATVLLHYGAHVNLRLDAASARHAMEAIGAHATRGGWVTVTDDKNRTWTILVTPGIPIWLESACVERDAGSKS